MPAAAARLFQNCIMSTLCGSTWLVTGGSDAADRFAIQTQRVRSLGGSSSGGLQWIVAEPRLIIAVEIELMRTCNRRGIIAERQLRHPICEGGMRGEVMIK
jgi:hypothetical protein